MAPTVHEIDPDGDAIIVLKNPGAHFAVWRDPSTLPSDLSWEIDTFSPWQPKKKLGKKSKRALRKNKPCVSYDWADDHQESTPDLPNSSVHEESVVGGSVPAVDERMVSVEPTPPPHDADQETLSPLDFPANKTKQEPDENAVYYRVSSRHLVLSCGYYKKFLTKEGWMESRPDPSDGKYHLTAEDWDPQAFLILLQIVHLQFRAVPRKLDLEMLAKMAVLVDAYCCSEAVELFSEMWIAEATTSSPVPTMYNRDLVLWMVIAWVFKHSDVFKRTTGIAVRAITTPTIQDMELPIPKSILDAIRNDRHQAIEDLISTLHNGLEKLRSPSYSCLQASQYSFACSSMLLGALTKEIYRIGCSPRPYFPFRRISFEQLIADVQKMQVPQWSHGGGYGWHYCNFEQTVLREAKVINENLTGLDLSRFQGSSSTVKLNV